jgi:predicted component of type VI protein secretion system
MSVSNYYGQKSKYRITLEIDALDDFNPHQIDWRKVLQLEGDESVQSVIEDLNIPVSW